MRGVRVSSSCYRKKTALTRGCGARTGPCRSAEQSRRGGGTCVLREGGLERRM
nr:hypothetical protein RVX_1702 [Nitratidesulfovibrio sp. HK-II]